MNNAEIPTVTHSSQIGEHTYHFNLDSYLIHEYSKYIDCDEKRVSYALAEHPTGIIYVAREIGVRENRRDRTHSMYDTYLHNVTSDSYETRHTAYYSERGVHIQTVETKIWTKGVPKEQLKRELFEENNVT
ncbi:hypothetical protein [Scytonema sp. NUACC26]|uniref:hypothetical protein n=1 Tax=Scytonema sp. NUACC26 TaxID=3140176 RepID=UPI0034DC069E